ncbi:MAG TPA: hypothetical protein VNT26_06510, partial [Candidatus Sulfotelmatobacter sp.]|nr:hypothetical protein [Candidatus Sulfotelmatobacter sp.]
MSTQPSGLSRRAMLKSVAVAGLGAALPRLAFGQAGPRSESTAAVVRYLESLARPDGGYAWADQPESHLTPTYAVIGCYRVL